MSNVHDIKSSGLYNSIADVAVSFGDKFQASLKFDRVFQEGMALVERTASYLDGDGRKSAKTLDGQLVVLYTTESMRLTTRLLDMASWLLIRRSLKRGEITFSEAEKKRERIKLVNIGRPSHILEFIKLPNGLRNLIEESFALQDRIVQLDLSMTKSTKNMFEYEDTNNPVREQLLRLENAFTKKN